MNYFHQSHPQERHVENASLFLVFCSPRAPRADNTMSYELKLSAPQHFHYIGVSLWKAVAAAAHRTGTQLQLYTGREHNCSCTQGGNTARDVHRAETQLQLCSHVNVHRTVTRIKTCRTKEQ